MPIFRSHPGVPGAYYLKRLPSEPRFEGLAGVDVDVSTDLQTVSGLGSGTRSVKVTIRAKDALGATITHTTQNPKVQLAISPANGQISIGSVTSLGLDGDRYVFEVMLTVTLTESPVTPAKVQQLVRAAVESDAGRSGSGFTRFYYVTTRPTAVTSLVATSWIRGIRLTWETPDEQRDGDAIINNTTLSYYLVRKSVLDGDPAPTLTITEARSIIATGGAPGSPENTRLYAVTGNAFVDPEQLYTHRFYYWLVSVDLFGNLSTLSNSANATPGRIDDPDFLQGSIDIARMAEANSVPNAMAAGTVTATKVGVLNAAFDPSKFTSNSPAAGQVSWANLIVVINGTRYPTVSTTFSGSTSSPVIIYDSSANNVVGVASIDNMDAGDMLLGFNVSGTFRPSISGTVIRGDTIETGTILADKLDVNELSAITANLGRITTGLIWNSATAPSSVIRLDTATQGITQNAAGQPVIAITTPANGTVSITSGVATFTPQITLSAGDTFIRGTQAYQVNSVSGNNYLVSPSTNASGSYIAYRRVSRLLDLAASDTAVDGIGEANRRFLSVVGSGGEDRIYITAKGDAKFTGTVQSNDLLITPSQGSQGLLRAEGPATFTNVVTGAEFNLENANINVAKVNLLRSESTSSVYAQLGQYDLAPTSVGVEDRTAYGGVGTSSTVTTTAFEVAAASNTFELSTRTASGIAVPSYTGTYLLKFSPTVTLYSSIGSGTALPSPIITIVVERQLGVAGTWTPIASRTIAVDGVYGANTYTDYDQYGIPNSYITGYDIGVGPGVTYGAPGSNLATVKVVRNEVNGAGTVSVVATGGGVGTATFQYSQNLGAGDWFRVGFNAYRVLSGSGTSYSIEYIASNASNQSFKLYDYSTSITVSGVPYDPSNHPNLRVRVQGQTQHDTFWDSSNAPEYMEITPVTYTIDGPSSSIFFQHLAAGSGVSRPASLALVGGFLYLEPKTSLPGSGIAGEIIVRNNNDVITPMYYNGTAWVAFGGGGSSSISVNGTAGITALTFSGATVSTSGNSATITITPSATGVTSIGGATGAITLGSNLAIAAGVLNTTGLLPLTGGTLTGNLTVSEGNNITLKAGASEDIGDLIWATSAGVEKHRIYDQSNNLVYRYNAGTSYKLLHEGNYSTFAVPLAGGTMTGGLTTPSVNATTAITIGDASPIAGAALRVAGDIRSSGTIYANDFVLDAGSGSSPVTNFYLDYLQDVEIGEQYSGGIALGNGQILQFENGVWKNKAAAFGSQLAISEEGTQLTASASSINFVGSNVTATNVGNAVTVSISAATTIAGITGLQTALDGKQPLDSDLTAIAGLADAPGFLKKVSDGSWVLDNSSYLTTSAASSTYLTTASASSTYLTITAASSTYLTGNQTITLSGDVTGSGATSITAEISAATVTGKVLTGYSVGANTALAATDTILGAFQKVQGQLNNKASTAALASYLPLTGGTLTGALNGTTIAASTALAVGDVSGMTGNSEIVKIGGSLRVSQTIYANDFVLQGGTGGSPVTDFYIDYLQDVTTSGAYVPSNGQVLTWNQSLGQWIPGTPSSGTSVTVSDDTSTNASRYVTFSSATSGTVSSLNVASSKLTFNPSTGVLTASGGFGGLTSAQVTTALGYTPYNSTNPNSYISGITSSMVTTALGYTPLNAASTDYTRAPDGPNADFNSFTANSFVSAAYATANGPIADAVWYNLVNIRHRGGSGDGNIYGGQIAFGMTSHQNRLAFRAHTAGTWQAWTEVLTGISSSMVTSALGYTPYNSTNPAGYISGITSGMVTTALGYTPYNSTNPAGYISGITSSMVTTALGYTPYNSTNPNGYITSAALSSYLPLAGGTMTGVITTVGLEGSAVGGDSGLTGGWYRFGYQEAGGWTHPYPDLVIGYHTGMKFGANTSYGGMRFYSDHPYGSSTILFSIGNGDSHVRVANNLYVGGNLALHAGNYNNYSPTLVDGVGASGTWPINITGNAGTATSATSATNATNATNSTNATNATYGRYVYDDGAYSGGAAYREPSGMYVYYAYLGRLVYDSGANGGSQVWKEPSQLYVAYATSAGSAGSVAWTNVSGRPTAVSSFTNDSGYQTSSGSVSYATGAGYASSAGAIAGYNNPDAGSTANTIAYRNGNADVSMRELILTGGANSATPDAMVAFYPGTNQVTRYTTSAVAVAIRGAASGTWGISVTGTAGSISGYNNPTTAATGSTIAYRDGSGQLTSVDFILSSDARLKTNLVPLASALDSLDRINAYRYTHLRTNRQEVGVLAQEIQQVLPEAVAEGEDGMLAVAYDRVVPLLVAAVKELKARVIELENKE